MKHELKPTQLLNKFIHAAYSDLFVIVQDITIEGKGKSRNFEDFIKNWNEQDREIMNIGESYTKSTYARILLREETMFFYLCHL